MVNKRGFVFSIDAFVAFSLALVALYSLVFFSAVPYNYYPALMQAHNYAKDTLFSLSKMPSPEEIESGEYSSALAFLVFPKNTNGNGDMAEQYLDSIISQEYGYILEAQYESGKDWHEVVSTLDKKKYNKLKAVGYTVLLGFDEEGNQENPYGYITCSGTKRPCATESSYKAGKMYITLVRLTIYA